MPVQRQPLLFCPLAHMQKAHTAIDLIAYHTTSDGCSDGSTESPVIKVQRLGRSALGGQPLRAGPRPASGILGAPYTGLPLWSPCSIAPRERLSSGACRRPPHAPPHFLAPPVRAMPPLRSGKPVRHGEWPSGRAMLVHAGGDPRFCVAGAACRGTRYRLYLLHLR